ncbi:thiamine-phosphate synthase [Haloferula helveola]|uniref:Thiamine-phosphate synthase n=1 Tax=Haloferula helveola TaxID=490095 RepID=A0ABM7RCR3_9BACT|nr:thiamine-phosphate synthase [Haloferula helveola]
MVPDLSGARLYAILDLGYVPEPKIEEVTRALLEGGADVLQLRAKGHSEERILEFGKRTRPICRDAGVPFIVNDHPSLAVELDADGLHLGQDDGSLEEARKRIGPDRLLGRSTHSPTQAKQALEDGFDYIGFGPLFPTPTKKGRPGIGLENVEGVEQSVGMKIPVFCIGGIKRANLEDVISAGARRVVIVSDLLTASDVSSAVRQARLQITGS